MPAVFDQILSDTAAVAQKRQIALKIKTLSDRHAANGKQASTLRAELASPAAVAAFGADHAAQLAELNAMFPP
jgi:hypothetical protein